MVNMKEVTEKTHFTALLVGNSIGWIIDSIFGFLLATIGVLVMYAPITILLVKGLYYTPSIVGAVLTSILIVNYTYTLHNKQRLKEIIAHMDRATFLLVYLAYNIIILIYSSVSNYLWGITEGAIFLALFWFSIDAWLIDHDLDKFSLTGIVITLISKAANTNIKDYSLFGGTGFTGVLGKLQNVFQ